VVTKTLGTGAQIFPKKKSESYLKTLGEQNPPPSGATAQNLVTMVTLPGDLHTPDKVSELGSVSIIR